jgi:haloacid dehalogenase superfamily, subfamily IA, variant 1 with third motif having Dx(3-4)D or Dx(3-4)E
MRPAYETVIFDKDGTLLDSAPGVMNAVRYALERLGLPFPEGVEQRSLIGPPLRYGYSSILGVSDDMLERAVVLHREYYGKYGLYEAELYPGIMDLVRELHGLGVKVCVATSKFHVLAERMLEHFGLTPFLHYSVMSEGTELTSTKQAMLDKVLTHCGTPREQTVMVGDTIYDVEGAQGAGLPFIGVLFGYGTREQMEHAGARRFAGDAVDLRRQLFV